MMEKQAVKDKYTPHDVARFMRDYQDNDLGTELRSFIPKLPTDDQRLIMLYSRGLSPRAAAKQMGLKINAQRKFNMLIQDLARKASGRWIE